MNSLSRRLVFLDSGNVSRAESLRGLAGAVDDEVTLVDPLVTLPKVTSASALGEHARVLAARLGPAAGPLWIVTQCTNAALAIKLAAELTINGPGAIRLLIFAPVEVDRVLLAQHAAELFAGLGMPEEQARESAENIARLEVPLDRALELASAQLSSLATTSAQAMELNETETESFSSMLCDRYDRWLSYLANQIGFEPAAVSFPIYLVDRSIEHGLSPKILAAAGSASIQFHRCETPQEFSEPTLQRLFAQIIADVTERLDG